MKGIFKGIFILSVVAMIFSCASTPKHSYKIFISPEISNPFVRSAWLSYTSVIRADMDKFYNKNSEGEYTIPFNTELEARNSMIDFYLRVQKDYIINDQYFEDLIKIRSSNKFKEYVFFSFNPGNWINEKNFNEEEYKQWMNNNMPEHIPLTLARVEKND